MTKEELQKVDVGETLIMGKNHYITVQRNLGDRVIYKENGFYHEVNYEYLYRPKYKMTNIIKYINTHIESSDDVLIKELLNKYLWSSYSYYKIGTDNSEISIQPGWPEKIVLNFSAYSDPEMAYHHKTKRLVVNFTDGTMTEISLYKFKRFCKRDFK